MDDDTAAQVRRRAAHDPPAPRDGPAEALPHLMRFMGFTEGTEPLESSTPEVIRARTSQILCEMCLSASRPRPLVVVLEDLHWVDPASETLGAMGEISGVVAPLLLILTCRPDYWPSVVAAGPSDDHLACAAVARREPDRAAGCLAVGTSDRADRSDARRAG